MKSRRNIPLIAMTVTGLLLLAIMAIGSSLVPPEAYRQTLQSAAVTFVPRVSSADPLVTAGNAPTEPQEPTYTPLSSGASTPKVTVTLFGSLPCTTCQTIEDVMLKLLKTNATTVRFAWKDFPLSVGGSASLLAARAGRCAASQGAFGPYHRALLSAPVVSVANLVNIAASVRLHNASFDRCLNSTAYDALIQTDIEEGERLAVTGTPTVFVGSTKLSPPVDMELLSATINEALKRK